MANPVQPKRLLQQASKAKQPRTEAPGQPPDAELTSSEHSEYPQAEAQALSSKPEPGNSDPPQQLATEAQSPFSDLSPTGPERSQQSETAPAAVMIFPSMEQIANVQLAALAKRVSLPDTRSAGELVDQNLKCRVLQNYREQLASLHDGEAVRWLIERLASLEVRVMLLQSAAIAAPTAGPVDFSSAMPDESFFQPDPVTIPFDSTLVQTGFFPAEQGPDGPPYRWLGPDPVASVVLPRIGATIRVIVTILSAHVQDAVANMRLSLDGGEWVGVEVQRVGNLAAPTATVSAGPDHCGTTMRLSFDVGRTESPLEQGGQDKRRLSVAISKLDVYRA